MKVYLFDKNDSLFEEVKRIREAVFTNEQNIPVNEDLDEFDKDEKTVYCLVYDGEPLATGRLIYNGDYYKIGRVATLKAARKRGCGTAVVNALCEKSKALGAEYVIIEAQLHAVEFYNNLGFEIISDDVIIDRGIKHKAMRKNND